MFCLYYERIVWKVRAGCLFCFCFEVCMLSVIVCFIILLVSLAIFYVCGNSSKSSLFLFFYPFVLLIYFLFFIFYLFIFYLFFFFFFFFFVFRLPIFQSVCSTFLVPLMAMRNAGKWTCDNIPGSNIIEIYKTDMASYLILCYLLWQAFKTVGRITVQNF